jgi:hypothetical protein
MHKKAFSSVALLALALAGSATTAKAGIVLYSDPTTWTTALASGTTTSAVDFTNAQGLNSSSFTSDGVTFTGNPRIFGPGTLSSYFSNQYYVDASGLVTMTISETLDLYAIGFYEACVNTCTNSYQNFVSATSTADGAVTLFNQTPYAGWSNLYIGNVFPSYLFFGIISTSPLTQIVVTSNDMTPVIAVGEVTLGTNSGTTDTSDTPEAATLILIGSGLAVIARYRKYGTNHSATA